MYIETTRENSKGSAASIHLNQVIMYHCAPTIAGFKPASLLNFTVTNHLYQLWCRYSVRQFNNLLANLNFNYNINFYVLTQQPGTRILVLVYNPDNLTTLLKQPVNQYFLATLGYHPTFSTSEYLLHLTQKINCSFPHEIGIFLGFPILDVIGFIRNKGKNYLLNKYWKVYTNPQKAKKIFARYDQAKMEVIEKWHSLFPSNPSD